MIINSSNFKLIREKGCEYEKKCFFCCDEKAKSYQGYFTFHFESKYYQFSSFLFYLTGEKGPFTCLGFIFLFFALFLNKLVHFVQFEDHTHEIFNIQVTNIYQQPFIIHSYAVRRYSSSSLLDDNEENEGLNNNNGNTESNTQLRSQNTQNSKKSKKKKYLDLNYREVLKNRRAIFAFLSIALSLSLWTFIDTTLTEKLSKDFNLESYLVCLFYSLQCAGFLLTSPHVHKIIKRSHPIKMIIIAFLFQALGVFLMGPSAKLDLPNLMVFTAIGLVIAGFSSPFISIIISYLSSISQCIPKC